MGWNLLQQIIKNTMWVEIIKIKMCKPAIDFLRVKKHFSTFCALTADMIKIQLFKKSRQKFFSKFIQELKANNGVWVLRQKTEKDWKNVCTLYLNIAVLNYLRNEFYHRSLKKLYCTNKPCKNKSELRAVLSCEVGALLQNVLTEIPHFEKLEIKFNLFEKLIYSIPISS